MIFQRFCADASEIDNFLLKIFFTFPIFKFSVSRTSPTIMKD